MQLRLVHLAEPVLGEPGVADVLTARHGGQVVQVSAEPAAELSRVTHVPMTGHDKAHPQHGRKPSSPAW